MTDEDDEFVRIMRETALRQANCQHRWEESSFGSKYWAPGTYQYACKRCHAMAMVIPTEEKT